MFNKKILVKYDIIIRPKDGGNETASEGIDTYIQNLKKLSPKLAEKIKSLPDNEITHHKLAIGKTILECAKMSNEEAKNKIQSEIYDISKKSLDFALPLQAVELTKFLDENFKDKKYQSLVSIFKKTIEEFYTKAAIDAKYKGRSDLIMPLNLWENVKDLAGVDANKYELVKINYSVDENKIKSILNTKEKIVDSFLPVKVGTYTYNGKENEIILKKMGTMGVIIELEGIKTEYKFNEDKQITFKNIKENIDKLLKDYEKEEKARKIKDWLSGIQIPISVIKNSGVSNQQIDYWLSYFSANIEGKIYGVGINVNKVDIDKNEIIIDFDDMLLNERFNKNYILKGVINKDGSIDIKKFETKIKYAISAAANRAPRYSNGDEVVTSGGMR